MEEGSITIGQEGTYETSAQCRQCERTTIGRPALFRVYGVTFIVAASLIIFTYMKTTSLLRSASTSSAPLSSPKYGDPQSAFDAFFGGQDALGDGLYRDCVPASTPGTSPIPTVRVIFGTNAGAISIAWQACTSDHYFSWHEAAEPYLPADTQLLQDAMGIGGVEMDVYSSKTVAAETGSGTFSAAGGPGMVFHLTSGNALSQ